MNRTKSILVVVGIMLALVFTFSCSSNDDDSGGGGSGSETGTVILKNTSGSDLTSVEITNGGKRAGYDARIGNDKSETFSKVPRGLCTVSFKFQGENVSHNFTVSPGEKVTINFTQFGNFVITRSGGDNKTPTGSVKIVNTYKTGTGDENTIVRVMVYRDVHDAVYDYIDQITPIIRRNSSKTYPDIEPGTYDVLVTFQIAQGNMLVNRGTTIEDIIVKAGETTVVNVPP